MISTVAPEIVKAGGNAALGAALPVAGAAATGIYQAIKSAPHNVANIVVQKVDAPFDQALAQAAAIRETDPDRARQILQDGYAQYQAGIQAVSDAGAFAPGAKPISSVQKVIDQSLSLPAKWNTVNTLAGQLGMVLNPGSKGNLNGTLTASAAPPGQNALDIAANGFVEGDHNPALVGTKLSDLPGVPAAAGGSTSKPSGSTTPAAAGAATGVAGVLGKIFGVNTGGGQQSVVDQLIKMGVPLTAAILNGVSATKAADVQTTAADRSAQLISDAAKNSLDFEKQVYGDQQSQTAPYRTAGTNALDKIQTYLGIGAPPADGSPRPDPSTELTTTPRYKLDFSEGIKALNAANRGVVSGSTIKAAEKFGQGLADKTFDSNFNNLSTVAGLGSNNTQTNINAGTNAVNTTTGINTNTALNTGNAAQTAAAARASGYGNGVLSQVLNDLQKQQLLKQIGF